MEKDIDKKIKLVVCIIEIWEDIIWGEETNKNQNMAEAEEDKIEGKR